MQSYYIETYGCQMNAHDSEKIAGILDTMGLRAAEKEQADIILFNTCCVREHAEKRVFGNLGALQKLKIEKPNLVVAVCGCMMQQTEVRERLYHRFPFVDLIIGTNALHMLPQLLERVFCGERVLFTQGIDDEIAEDLPTKRAPGVAASVSIMHGCNNFCTYCIVPYVRGRERSRQPGRIISEIQALAEQGYSEVLLLGQNVNSYGNNLEDMDFSKLLRMVNDIDGIKRIRFMTSHPKDLSSGLIAAMAGLPKICSHLHLPVQSGSTNILKLMNRGYTRQEYLALTRELRLALPNIELTTDIIVGFPGETEADFEETLSIVDEVGFSAAFTFMFSPRTGTAAANLPEQVSQATKKNRLQQLNALQTLQTRKTNERYLGRVEEVLVDGFDQRTKLLYGKLSCFKTVYFPGAFDMIGSYMGVFIEKTHNSSLLGLLEQKVQ